MLDRGAVRRTLGAASGSGPLREEGCAAPAAPTTHRTERERQWRGAPLGVRGKDAHRTLVRVLTGILKQVSFVRKPRVGNSNAAALGSGQTGTACFTAA